MRKIDTFHLFLICSFILFFLIRCFPVSAQYPQKITLRACEQSENLLLPEGWCIRSVEENFISAATEFEKHFPTGQKAKVIFERDGQAWARMYVTAVLWDGEIIKGFNDFMNRKMHQAMQLPRYVGQSRNFRFMLISEKDASDLLSAIRNYDVSAQSKN